MGKKVFSRNALIKYVCFLCIVISFLLCSSGLAQQTQISAPSILDGIAPGKSISRFSVNFEWLGVDMPGSQYYEIIDPLTFAAIESGYTTPEPATGLVLLSGVLLLRRKNIRAL